MREAIDIQEQLRWCESVTRVRPGYEFWCCDLSRSLFAVQTALVIQLLGMTYHSCHVDQPFDQSHARPCSIHRLFALAGQNRAFQNKSKLSKLFEAITHGLSQRLGLYSPPLNNKEQTHSRKAFLWRKVERRPIDELGFSAASSNVCYTRFTL